MPCLRGFDNDMYLRTQSQHIKERIDRFGGKLYLEFGGKLFDDYHASRVLPGFKPDSKISMLMEMKDQTEAIIAINAEDIVGNKIRKDMGIGYDQEALRLADAFIDRGIPVVGIVVTRYSGQPSAEEFCRKAESMGLKVYFHYPIPGYPTNIPLIASDEGYGRNDFVPTSKPLVVVTAPGPGSGKMAVCLSQLYHEHKRGVPAGYAKFETFPIWNIPINHPVNLAYEAATIDLMDKNMIDPYHLEAYGVTTVNYNRDIEVFPVLNAMLAGVSGTTVYRSPTDMGVNMAGNCIVDDQAVREAANKEILRRHFSVLRDRREGKVSDDVVFSSELLMKRAGIDLSYRPAVTKVRSMMAESDRPVVAAELPDGRVVTGKSSPLLTASAAMILNSLKVTAGIDDHVLLISPEVIRSMQRLKVDYLGNRNPRLHIDEMLVALSIAANTDPIADKAFSSLPKLTGCDVHSSYVVSASDEALYKKLGMYLSTEPEHQTKCFYHGN
ncbi:MAG: DUF1846 domain-containing protein [Candidatus Methanomethylophilaceae archaeon]|nr:DUF1846 domain-containing protein [Candidatus Methanomethylophilaceae archaeon]